MSQSRNERLFFAKSVRYQVMRSFSANLTLDRRQGGAPRLVYGRHMRSGSTPPSLRSGQELGLPRLFWQSKYALAKYFVGGESSGDLR